MYIDGHNGRSSSVVKRPPARHRKLATKGPSNKLPGLVGGVNLHHCSNPIVDPQCFRAGFGLIGGALHVPSICGGAGAGWGLIGGRAGWGSEAAQTGLPRKINNLAFPVCSSTALPVAHGTCVFLCVCVCLCRLPSVSVSVRFGVHQCVCLCLSLSMSLSLSLSQTVPCGRSGGACTCV